MSDQMSLLPGETRILCGPCRSWVPYGVPHDCNGESRVSGPWPVEMKPDDSGGASHRKGRARA